MRSIIFCLLMFCTSSFAHEITLGEERLLEPEFSKLILGKRIGVLAHHASRDHQGQHLVDRLNAMPGVQLKMIFAPEHGYRSIADELNPDSIDTITGLPVYSLYGPRKAPTTEMLNQLDLVVIDLQDVGLRYYTYPATLVYTLKAAKLANIPVIVLDRPNPLGGERIEGVMLEASLATGGLTTLASVPTRHGMTLGELARFYNERLKIDADLTVVPMKNWKREFIWTDTDQPWVPSSPALLRPEQVMTYAALGALESGEFAVGRGQKNDDAFMIYGAPYITSMQKDLLVARLNKLELIGQTFTAIEWTPDRAKFEGKPCRGFRMGLVANQNLDSFDTLVKVSEVLVETLGAKINLQSMLSMIGSHWALQGIMDSEQANAMALKAQGEMSAFKTLRAHALLY